MAELRLSVLIATCNRPELLRKALGALVDHSTTKPDEIVVVNGGDDRADEVVQEFQQRSSIRFRLIRTVNKNLATSRNLGLHACAGDIIAMTDDDAEVAPDWSGLMKRTHQSHPEAGAVGGAVIGISSRNEFLSRVTDVVTFPSPPTPRFVRTLPGVNISYKRQVIEMIGEQDEALFRGEDVDYNWRVKQLGYEIYYDPTITVTHHHRTTIQGFLNQHYMYGRAYVLVRRKWPGMYCVYPHGLQSMRHVLKLGYFFGALLIEPIRSASKLKTWTDRIRAIPLLVACQCVWRGGMLLQMWETRKERITECS